MQSKYMQGMIALSTHRDGDRDLAKAIIRSLKENAIYNEDLGMYWKAFNTGGYYWHEAPIESQALMIEAFTEIDKNDATIADLKTWLLLQKQTQNWKTTKATSEAIYALLLDGKTGNTLGTNSTATIQLGAITLLTDTEGAETGTGYFKRTIKAENVVPAMGNITVNISPSPLSSSVKPSPSWGAAYWQYFEDIDKISSAATPLRLTKKLFKEKAGDKGPVLVELTNDAALEVGDKVIVRITLKADRDMEYVHMKDLRAACMEPVNVISGYKYQGGAGYYESTKDASTNFFFSWLPRGNYVFEYALYATLAGNYSNGITTIQCMYAPEFSSHSEGLRVTVK